MLTKLVEIDIVPVMKLSNRGEYALRALLVLGLHYGEKVVPIHTISAEQNIPRKFLDHILSDLKQLGAVESDRGFRGGYRLARPPEHITLASVIRHLEGAMAPVGCVSERFYERCTCPNEALCPIRDVMKEAREGVVQLMERTTLADLIARGQRLENPPPEPADYAI
jgi:Rrf2 family protein